MIYINMIAIFILTIIEILLLTKSKLRLKLVGSGNNKEEKGYKFTFKDSKIFGFRLSKYPHQLYLI